MSKNVKEIKLESFQLGANKITHKNMVLNSLFSQVMQNGLSFIENLVRKLVADRINSVAGGELDMGDLSIAGDLVPFKQSLLKIINEQVPPSGISFGEMKARLKMIDVIEAATGKTMKVEEKDVAELQKIASSVRSKDIDSSMFDDRLALVKKVSEVEEGGKLPLDKTEYKMISEAILSMRWTVMDKNIVDFVSNFEE